MRGINETGGGASLYSALSLFGGNFGAFERDAGNHRNTTVGRRNEALDNRRLFVALKESAFASMTENGQAFHFFEAAEPGAEPLDGSVIDGAVTGEWGNGSGDKAA
jgi:hypothetical protein